MPLLGASENVIRERIISLPPGSRGQTFIETIRFAAANRLLVNIDSKPLSPPIRAQLIWSFAGDSTEAPMRTAMASKLGDAFGTLLTCRPGARSGCGEDITGR
jgi:hypothetical protein